MLHKNNQERDKQMQF